MDDEDDDKSDPQTETEGEGGGKPPRKRTALWAGGEGDEDDMDGPRSAIGVMRIAQREARRLGHNFVGTEFLLLGLIGQRKGIAAKTLESMGLTFEDAGVEVEKISGRGNGFVAVEIPFTPRAKRVLELSWDEARQLGHNYIGAEHLLLGLIREGGGVAVRVLENLGVRDMAKVRTEVMKLLQERGPR